MMFDYFIRYMETDYYQKRNTSNRPGREADLERSGDFGAKTGAKTAKTGDGGAKIGSGDEADNADTYYELEMEHTCILMNLM